MYHYNLSQEIKRCFSEAKRQQLGKSYSPAPRFNKPEDWYAAAEVCAELEANAANFVRAAFMFNNVPGGPFPKQLAGNAIRRWYNQYRTQAGADGKAGDDVDDQELRGMFKHATLCMLSQIKMRPRDFLLSEYTVRPAVVPAFVRVLLFPKDAAMLEKWGRLAHEELDSNPQALAAVKRLGYDISNIEKCI